MAIESVKNPEDEELIRKWQADYFEEKQKELEEKRAKKFSDKKSKNKIVEQQEKKHQEEEEIKLPKGATMFMEGFKDDTRREDIKEALKLQFDVELKAFAFMDFEKGQSSGHVRFVEENAAIELAAKMKEKLAESEKFKVKEADISFR